MRRKIATFAVLGGLAAGLGCQHIGGKADCGYSPADYPIGPPTPAYPIYPVVGAPPEVKTPAEATPIPKTKNGGSDKGPKDDGKGKDEKKDMGY